MTQTEQGTSASSYFHTADVVAGLSIAGLLLPEAVAYAGIGNVPPQLAVMALFAGLICYALIGSSRFAVVSATSSSAAVLAAATASIANGDAALRLTLTLGLVIVAGVYFVLASIARLGAISDFISKPVLRGFTFGLALVIILKQLPKIVGVNPDSGNVGGFAIQLFSQASEWNPVGLELGVGALVLLFIMARFRYVPGALIVTGIGIGLSHWINFKSYHVGLVGEIPLQLVKPTLPTLDRVEWLRLGELGLALVMILYAESYGSIRSFAIKHGDKVNPNRDLAALGIANMVSGLFHGMPVGAGYSVTAANEAAGAVSKAAGLIAAGVILIIVLTLLPLVALTPEPVLAAIVIHAVSHTLKPSVLRIYFQWRRDRIVVIASLIGVLALGVLDGLLAAIAISMFMMLRRFSESRLAELGRLGDGHDFVSITLHPEAKAQHGLLIVRPEEPLFFANAERIMSQVRHKMHDASADTHTVILSLEESPDLDSTSVEALRDFTNATQERGKQVMLCRLKDSPLDFLKRVQVLSLPDWAISGLSVDEAVHIAKAQQRSQSSSS
jgi:MFS superfamily sulfate permease-like transporter